jgi:hypothetical protein
MAAISAMLRQPSIDPTELPWTLVPQVSLMLEHTLQKKIVVAPVVTVAAPWILNKIVRSHTRRDHKEEKTTAGIAPIVDIAKTQEIATCPKPHRSLQNTGMKYLIKVP